MLNFIFLRRTRRARRLCALAACAAALLALLLPARAAHAQTSLDQKDIPGPPGSGLFGRSVAVLPNGNFVVTDPLYDDGGTPDVGAVYLYDGATLGLVSTLKGSHANDRVGGRVSVLAGGNFVVSSADWYDRRGASTWGHGATGFGAPVVVVSADNSLVGSRPDDFVSNWGVIPLTNGNYVVVSPYWDNGDLDLAGAVTWGDGATGTRGTISADNSLVGDHVGAMIGGDGVTALTNGNYVVRSAYWADDPIAYSAVTWGDGATGLLHGAVSPANSLVGSTPNDGLGSRGIIPLPGGNYLVASPQWDNGPLENAGALTWGDGEGGTVGPVTASNSLIGVNALDNVGDGHLVVLADGNYVALNWGWNGRRGAATWGSGASGVYGTISAANSLVGSTPADFQVAQVHALTNGNYVVATPYWDNGGIVDAGAVTWGSGTAGVSGVISASNGLVGSSKEDQVGVVYPLADGDYVVASARWDNGALQNAGAATWADGATGKAGPVSAADSLVGVSAGDLVGAGGVTALTNGNYVVNSPDWSNDTGATTWADGDGPTAGTVSAANSLVGDTPGDRVGWWAVALSNGNYVVGSPYWDGAAADAGAATWGSGAGPLASVVSTANSLVGGTAGDQVGRQIVALSNGNYAVGSPDWDDGGTPNAGAVTWGSGVGGTVGPVTPANSLVGSSSGDRLGFPSVQGALTALPGGNYIVQSAAWDGPSAPDAGAVTPGDGRGPLAGAVSADNSVTGGAAGGGESMRYVYDPHHRNVIVGRPADNTVSVTRAEFGRMILNIITRLE